MFINMPVFLTVQMSCRSLAQGVNILVATRRRENTLSNTEEIGHFRAVSGVRNFRCIVLKTLKKGPFCDEREQEKNPFRVTVSAGGFPGRDSLALH